MQDKLNREGQLACVYLNVEAGQTARDDVDAALRSIASHLALRAQISLGDNFLLEKQTELLAESGEHGVLHRMLTVWAQRGPKPIVLTGG